MRYSYRKKVLRQGGDRASLLQATIAYRTASMMLVCAAYICT